MEHQCTFWSPHFMSLLFLCCLLSGSNCGIIRPVPGLPMVTYSRPGNLTLGVVTSVHKTSANSLCGNAIYNIKQLQRIEAIAFAVEEINNSSELLPNITLGFAMLDDCSNAKVTLLRGLQLVQNPPTSKHSAASSPTTTSLPSVAAMPVAVIGADTNYRTRELARLLGVYKIPLLTYMATDPLLDSREDYPSFSRLIPSIHYQISATVDFLVKMGWTYVSGIFVAEHIGIETSRLFIRKLIKIRYCIAAEWYVNYTADNVYYQSIIYTLTQTPNAHAVVVFLDPERCQKLFKATIDSGLQDNVIWLISDTEVPWLSDYIGYEASMHGVLAISVTSAPVSYFDERFRRMTLGSASQNPWFHEYVSSFLNCSLNISSANACNPDREIDTSETYYPYHGVSLAIDAVYAWAHSLDKVTKNCTDAEVKNCVKPQQLLDTLSKLDVATTGRNIRFDKTISGMTSYNVHNFVWDNKSLVLNLVGQWNCSTQIFSYFRKDLIKWRHTVLTKVAPEGDVYPESVCSKPCPIGHEQVSDNPPCCFHCRPCDNNERTVAIDSYGYSNTRCQICPTEDNFTWPDFETRTKCLPIEAVYDLGWSKTKGIIIMIFDAMLLCSTAVTAAFLVKNSDEYLIKSTSLGMGLATLLGHGLMCVLIFSFVIYPTDVICIARTLSIHLSFPLSYAFLMVRANRIYNICIHNSTTTTTSKVLFNSARSQLTFGMIFVVLQVLTSSLSIGLQPPWTTQVMYNLHDRHVEQICSVQYTNLLGPILLNIFGMILCTIRAFQIRSVDGDFHEPNCIIIHIFCTAVIWLCFIPPYFFHIRRSNLLMSVVFALVLQMQSCQALLFLPKLYAIYFSPSSANSYSATDLSRSGAKTSYSGDIMSRSGAKTSHSGDIMSRSGAKTSYSGEIMSRSGAKTSYSGEILSRSGAKTSYSGEIMSRSGTITFYSGEKTSRSGNKTSYFGEKSSRSTAKLSLKTE